MMSAEIIHGDCLDVLRGMPDASVDAVVTDPPYMMGAASARVSADKPRPWASDVENAAYWFADWYKEAWRVLKANGCMWSFCNWQSLAVVQCAAAKSAMRVTSVLVWDKQWMGVGSTRGLRQSYEMVVLLAKPDFGIADRSVVDIWQCKWAGHKPSGHPAEKPVALVRRLLEVSGVPAGGAVVDPFAGSGTTGVACAQTGRSFIGIEREAAYVELARKRIADAQAQMALGVA